MPTAWSRQQRAGGHGLPRRQRLRTSRARASRTSSSRGTRTSNVPLNGCRGAGHLPLSRLRHGHRGLRRAQLQRRRHQLPAVQRRDGRRLRQRGQRRPRASTRAAARSAPWCANAWPANNGTDGLFLCWRVRHGVFEDNRLEATAGSASPSATRTPTTSCAATRCAGNASQRRLLPQRSPRAWPAPQPPGGQPHRGQRPRARAPPAS